MTFDKKIGKIIKRQFRCERDNKMASIYLNMVHFIFKPNVWDPHGSQDC